MSTGRLYEYNLTSKAFTYVYNFLDAKGSAPLEAPILFSDNGLLYGTTRNVPPGTTGAGAIYSFNTTTKVYTSLLNIPAEIGTSAYLTAAPNHKIYGLSIQGGTDVSGNHFGAIFEYVPSSNAIRLIHSFGNQADGTLTGSGYTSGEMTLASDGKFYGMTASHVFCFDYTTEKVTARAYLSLQDELGITLNAKAR